MRRARVLSLRGLCLAALLPLLGCGPSGDPLPARPVALDSLPPAPAPPTPAPRRVLVLSIDGLGGELCDRQGDGLPPSLAALIGQGCAPLLASPSGRLADRASLITGVAPGEHGVFADARVAFPSTAPGERSWPRGPRRAPHVWAPLLAADHAVTVLGLTGDYPPARSDRFTHIAGPVLPSITASGGASITQDALPAEGWSDPIEFSLTDAEGGDRMWVRARRGGSSAVITAASPHPAAPRFPLAWPPMAMLELWESGIVLQTTDGPPRGVDGRPATLAERHGWAAMNAQERVAAASLAAARWRPSLLWLSLDELWALEAPGVQWLAAVDDALAALVSGWPGAVLLVSTRGRAKGDPVSMVLEPGLRWSAPGCVRVDPSLPPARQRGLLARARAAAEQLPGVSRVLARRGIEGPVAGLAPDLQLVLAPGFRHSGQGTAETPGLVAGPLVTSGGRVQAAEVGRGVVQAVLDPEHVLRPPERSPVPSAR